MKTTPQVLTRRGMAALAIPFMSLLLTAPALQAQPPAGYYDTVNATNGATLRLTLHDVIDDHTRFPYTDTSTDTWDIVNLADEDPNNTGNIIDLYKNASYAKIPGGSGAYNREHSWPKSYGFPDDDTDNYPYTDTHQLFACDAGYNSSRSNKPFRLCDAGCSENPTDLNDGRGGGTGVYPGNSNWTTGSSTQGTWETWDGRKGDVARAMFYMDLRYEGGNHGGTGSPEPDLILTDNESLIDSRNTGANEAVAYMGMLSVLLQWHAQDPPDSREVWRNEVVFSFQGNRNPFIDHPEWAECLFNDLCPVEAGGVVLSEVLYDVSSSDDGFEWVELYNPGSSTVDLSGYCLGNGGTDYAYSMAQLVGTIASGATFVVGGPSSSAINANPSFDQALNFDPDFQNSGTTGDGVALFNMPCAQVDGSTVPVDAVVYGPNNDSGLIDESGSANAPEVGDAPPSSSIERLDVAGNWHIQSTPTPNATPIDRNTAPDVTISQPANGSSFAEGTSITFSGTATDGEDGDLTTSLSWTSNIDGTIGSGGSFSFTLSSGMHTITASVTDSNGLPGSDQITVTVTVNTCIPSDTTLCLPADNRFAVSVYFETTQGGGRMGDAQAIPLDSLGIDQGGIFYFVNSTNPEFLVKILNGCPVNNHWWVFYAATTNIGFELTVTDTATGTTRVYTNPDINPAEPVTDTQAFATCL